MGSTLNVPNLRVCVIDIGSNSTRYMIADLDRQARRITVLFQGTQITRMAAGILSGTLLPENASQTLEAVEKFFAHALSLAVSDFKIFGTAALREANNSEAFSQSVKEKIGYPLEIIDAEREAWLTEIAIAESFSLKDKNFCGLDIGGGSAQWIFHSPGKPSRLRSLPLGSVRLTKEFLNSDPPEPGQILALRKHVRQAVHAKWRLEENALNAPLIGVGGTITTVAAMIQGLKTYDHGKIHGCKIRRSQWEDLLKQLSCLTAAQRLSLPGLQRGREDIIIAGITVLDIVASFMDANEITVSDRGLLYGMLVEYLQELK